MDLFVENGHEETTVAQTADRAGLNRATFFRHFTDKREVLFGGEDVLAGLFGDAIRGAAPRSISTALREQGADELTARLAAEVGMLAFRIAVERWMDSDGDESFGFHAEAALSELRVRAAEFDSRSRLSARR